MSMLPSGLLMPGTPTLTVNTAVAGAGATATLATGSTNLEGEISFTTGTVLGTGKLLGLTFSNSQRFPNGTIPVFSPGSDTFAMVIGNLYAVDRVDGVDLYTRTALAASATYVGYYRLSGR